MFDFTDILFRTLFAFLIFMGIASVIGQRMLGQMNLNDFIIAVTLGSITANAAFNTKISIWNFVLSFVLFGIISYLMTFIGLKSRRSRKWISGQPTVIIENGKILEENLKKTKCTEDFLNQSLREKDIFNLDEVEFAILEADGHLSVLKKPEYRGVLLKDLQQHIPSAKENLPIELVMEGKVLKKNLVENNLSDQWLMDEVSKRGLEVKNVFYAVIGTNKQLYIDKYQDNKIHPVEMEP